MDLVFPLILTVLILFTFFMVALWRLPCYKLNSQDVTEIKTHGLIHYTRNENALQIIENGFQGNISPLGIDRILGTVVWFYIAGDEQTNTDNLKKVQGKAGREDYNTGIIISQFDDTAYEKMRIRKGFNHDRAVVYKTKSFKPTHMETLIFNN